MNYEGLRRGDSGDKQRRIDAIGAKIVVAYAWPTATAGWHH